MKECSKCGECCKYLSFQIDDPDGKWKEYYTMHGVKFVGTDMILLLIPHRCQHLTEDNKCDIYDTRPQICRDFQGQTNGYYVPDECTLK